MAEGHILEDQHQMEQELVSYYPNILSKLEGEGLRNHMNITQHIPRLVTPEHNAMLMRPIDRKEVEEDMMQLDKGTAPGLDGFIVDFFQQFWDLVKEEVWEIVEASRCSRRILKTFNTTFLTLIPKEQGVNTPEKFRPISLCNVILKIITKVLAN